MKYLLAIIIFCLGVSGCGGGGFSGGLLMELVGGLGDVLPGPGRKIFVEQYKVLGFNSKKEAMDYSEGGTIRFDLTAYFSLYLSPDEWRRFYLDFPEIWVTYAHGSSNLRQYPWRASIAWRWTTLNRMKNWDPKVTARLKEHQIESGDNAFKLIYAFGEPLRLYWDTNLEIFFYKPDKAFILEGGILKEERVCGGCWENPSLVEAMPDEDETDLPGMRDYEVLEKMNLN